MSKHKYQQVAKELFDGKLTEKQIEEKYQLRSGQIQSWMQSKRFQKQLHYLCQSAYRDTRFILARFGPLVAIKLTQLLETDKCDVARRTALDMIDRCREQSPSSDTDTDDDSIPTEELSDQQAQQMLLTLAGSMENQNNTQNNK